MGRVLNSPNGEGVTDAVVTLNNLIKGNCDDTLEINIISHTRYIQITPQFVFN